jgi:hypothetical protein
MRKYIEEGTKFEHLTVIEYSHTKDYNRYYKCKCDCGNTRDVKVADLLNKKVWNCGCKNFTGVKGNHKNMKYSPQEASYRAKAANYKSLAKNRKIEWNLTTEEVINLFKSSCFYCGKLPCNIYNVRKSNRDYVKNSNFIIDNYTIFYNGIDRIDNTKGYVKSNCVSCCTQCNTAKLNFTLDEFKNWIINVYNNFKKD